MVVFSQNENEITSKNIYLEVYMKLFNISELLDDLAEFTDEFIRIGKLKWMVIYTKSQNVSHSECYVSNDRLGSYYSHEIESIWINIYMSNELINFWILRLEQKTFRDLTTSNINSLQIVLGLGFDLVQSLVLSCSHSIFDGKKWEDVRDHFIRKTEEIKLNTKNLRLDDYEG